MELFVLSTFLNASISHNKIRAQKNPPSLAMQPSSFRQAHPSGTRFSLAKFSYTTTPIDHPSPLSWSHINGHGDLVCVFDKIAVNAPAVAKLIMRVIRNDTVLEQIDIARLVQSASSEHPSVPKNTFAVVIKSPCLAVKYPQNGSIRRFQIKFLTERDFYSALALLSEIDCPFTEGNATIVQQPRRLPSSSSLASFQTPTVIWNNGNATMTPESNVNDPIHRMAQWQLPGCTAVVNPTSPSSYITPDSALAGENPSESAVPKEVPNISVAQALPDKARVSGTSTVQQTVAPEKSGSRPSTTHGYHDIQELNQVLPPKRDLPFLKPGSKRKRTESTAEPTGEKLKSSRVNQLSNQPTKKALERCDTVMSDNSSQSLVPTQPYPESAEPPNIKLYTQSNKEIPVQEPIERLPTTIATATACTAPTNVQVERTPSCLDRAAPTSVEEQLSAYLSSPNPERVAFLENWMCELVNDDSFMTLCEDVEATWRRFAFGIKK